MMIRTHLAVIILAVLLFLPHVTNKFIFITIALIATCLPDIDNGFSTFGRLIETRVVQFLVRHRGILHSFTFCIVVAFLLAVFLPSISLAFFLGYSLHLFTDSFTREGIKPFWPYKISSSWRIKTGGLFETNIFLLFLILDIFVFIFLAKNIV